MNGSTTARWTVIADDLTGAADSVAAYGAAHSSTVILDVRGHWPDARILAVNTESRHLPEAEAAGLVGYCARRSLDLNRKVFKKVDSLLRGHPGVETAAALSCPGDAGIALVAPAFPGTGRTTAGGVVHVNGIPHTAGPFGGDVRRALAEGGLEATVISRAAGRTPAELAGHLGQLQQQGVRAAVVDAESDQDLRDIVLAAGLLGGRALLVGSGGLAGHLLPGEPGLPGEKGDNHGGHSAVRLGSGARALCVIGSYSPLAAVQLTALLEAGASHLVLDHSRLDAIPAGLAEAIMAGDVVLTPDPSAPLATARAAAVARSLADAALSVRQHCDLLVVSGGETARAVLDALGTKYMEVLGQLEPGVVVNRLPGSAPLFVTKAGAFGDARTLVRTVETLKPTTSEMSTT